MKYAENIQNRVKPLLTIKLSMLIVGYLDFDEDGGAADGIADEIEYEYSEIIKEIKDYVSDQEKKFKQELKITEIIGEALGAKGE